MIDSGKSGQAVEAQQYRNTKPPLAGSLRTDCVQGAATCAITEWPLILAASYGNSLTQPDGAKLE